ncbi:MAG: leucyl aminopeptidase family protein, partial [Candidatus Aminicenantes bacterium]|nr:leucyl aminopeptidase family protein [Candidatus Aminicenantes bacterium]
MKIKKKKAIDWKSIEGVVIPVFKNRSIGEVVKQYPEVESFLKKYKFKGNINESIVVNSTELSKLLVVVGAGHVKQRGDAAKCANNIISIVKNYLLKNICVHFVQDTDIPDTYSTNFIDFLHINHYRFDAYLEKKEKDKKIKNISLVFECQKQISSEVIKEREIISNSLIMVRDLVNEIPEKLNPDTLVDAFVKVSKELDLDISVMRQKQLEEQKLKGIILVGRASPYEPALIRIGYTPDNYKKTLIVVGKGITFDSGGLNIKVGNYMEEMKCDMAGAATVLGIIKSAAELKLPVRIIAYAGIAENMPGRQAYKPGDIITYKNNKTVEVVNTDAEGRLVLADALIQAAKEKPDYIVEFSTLTGAILVALGDMIAGVMCDNQRFTR